MRSNMERPVFTGERFIPDVNARSSLFLEHVSRYRLATHLAAGKRVLDAATGVGYGAALLAEAGAASVIGIDLDQEAVDYATQRYGADNITFRVDDVTKLATVEDASVDLFVCFETIEHVEGAAEIIQQAARILTPEGVFLCSTPNYEVSQNQNPFHVKEYLYPEFVELLSKAFRHSEILLQRTTFANRIVGVDPLTEEAVGEMRTRPFIELLTRGEDIGSTPFFIGLASKETPLEPLSLISLGAACDTEQKNKHIQILEGGVAERDGTIQSQQSSIQNLEAEHDRLKQVLANGDAELERLKQRLSDSDAERQRLEQVLSDRNTEREKTNRYIQNLEGGVLERDSQLQELQARLAQPGLRFAARVLGLLGSVDRKLNTVPSRIVRRLAPRQKADSATKPTGSIQNATLATASEDLGPRFSIIVPVYEHLSYLKACLDSALNQTFDDYEVVIYDDASPDPKVAELLCKYSEHPKARVHFGTQNLGISRATNRAIALSTGQYISFLDCDDVLEADALARVSAYLDKHPDTDFVYTNRIDIDDDGKEVNRWDFSMRALSPPAEELMIGMFTSHFKAIRRSAFRAAGLFRAEFDSVQDYEISLRLAESCRLGFLNEYPYRHRVHGGQTTKREIERADELTEAARTWARQRRDFRQGNYSGLVSIVILSLNRSDDTIRCLEAIERHTPIPHEILIIDNASEPAELEKVRAYVQNRANVELFEESINHGVAGGRNLGASRAKGDYVVFLDNDIVVDEDWLVHLLTEMESDERLAACCCRVVFPDKTVQFTGGTSERTSTHVSFSLLNSGRPQTDLATYENVDCDWIPGGATIFRAAVFKEFPYDTEFAGAFEDNDWSATVKAAGYRLSNAPLASVLHNHMNYSVTAQQDKHYTSQRYNPARLERALRHFHKKHGLLIADDELYHFLGYQGSNDFLTRVVAQA